MPTPSSSAASATEAPAPAALGYRWPAEWERHSATWLSWPHNLETWPGRLARVEETFARLVEALVDGERVCVNVGGAALEERARKVLRHAGVDPERSVEFHTIPTDDAWARDHGPLFVVRDGREHRERAVVDFAFDNWGRKYPGWAQDAEVARRVAEARRLRRFATPWVLEGGALDGNGHGSVLATESCLLHPNRGPGRTRERLERVLAEFLGADRVVWLAAGIAGDDTDGHVDDVARFVAPRTVVAARCDDRDDPDHAPLEANWQRLQCARDAHGRRLDLVELPVPPPLVVEGVRLPASYANFYLANGVALVPTFAAPTDARALAVLRELLPERRVVGIPSVDLVVGLGALHCITQQEPSEVPA